MHLLQPERTLYPARLILLIGMLASLCFSAGEGIRLLPFPSSGVANGATQIVQGRPLRAYAFSLHRPANGLMRSIKRKQKHRRDPNPSAQDAGGKAISFSLQTCHLPWVDEILHHAVRPLRASLADRAPPSS